MSPLEHINILHLSDLHFNRDKEITPNVQQNLSLQKLLDTLRVIDDEWKPKIVVISGDIGWKGKKEDYQKAEKWIRDLLQILELHPNRLLICPGNHDINLQKVHSNAPKAALDADNWLSFEKIKTFEMYYQDYINFLKKLSIQPNSVSKGKNYLFGYRNVLNLNFFTLNSSWFSRGLGDKEKGKLWIGLPLLHILEHDNSFAEVTPSSPISLTIIHHPENWYNEAECGTYDGRPGAYNYLAKRSNIILSGHTHSEYLDAPDLKRQTALHFVNGATYSKMTYRNNFSILKLLIRNRSVLRRTFYSNSKQSIWIEEKRENTVYGLFPPKISIDIGSIKGGIPKESFSIQLGNHKIEILHIFLNEINRLLENEFEIVKEKFYANAWKVGIILEDPVDHGILFFSLFSIPWHSNEPAIKQISIKERNDLLKKGISKTSFGIDWSFLMNNPLQTALDLVLERVEGIIDQQGLNHEGNLVLAYEVISAGIKNSGYDLDETVTGEFDIDEIYNFFSTKAFHKELNLINSRKLGLKIILELLEYLKSLNHKTVRICYNRSSTTTSKDLVALYNSKTAQEIEEEARFFYKNIAEIYNTIVQNNFPKIKDKLEPFNGSNKILVVLHLKDKYLKISEYPKIEALFLKSEECNEIEIEVYTSSQRIFPTITNQIREEGIILNQKKYSYVNHISRGLDFLFSETPLLDFIYEEIKRNLRKSYHRKFFID